MSDFDYKIWQGIRKKGRARYLFEEGIRKFVLPYAVLTVLLSVFFEWKGLSHLLTAETLITVVGRFVVLLLIGIPIGLLTSWFSWRRREKSARRYEKEVLHLNP